MRTSNSKKGKKGKRVKRTSVESYIDIQPISDNQVSAVMEIAAACSAEIGLDDVGGNRLPKWTTGLPFWDQAVLLRYLGRKNRVPDVLMIGHHVIGYLFYTVRPKTVVIDQLAVSPEYRRNGYATRMITRLKSEMPALQRQTIGVKVAERNLSSQLMFRENGFRWFRTVKAARGGQDDYLMRFRSSNS